jgi:hypothetical protein
LKYIYGLCYAGFEVQGGYKPRVEDALECGMDEWLWHGITMESMWKLKEVMETKQLWRGQGCHPYFK